MNRPLAHLPGEVARDDRATSWLRTLRHAVFFLLGAALAAVSLTYLLPVLKEHRTLAAQEDQVSTELGRLRDAAAVEQEKLHWMRNDPEYLEIQARDRLDLQAPDESIIRFQPAR